MPETNKLNIKKEGEISTQVVQNRCTIGVARLNKEIKISPKSAVHITQGGYTINYLAETANLTLNIEGGFTAELIMSKEAFDAVRAGAEVTVVTAREFQDKYSV